MSSLSTSDIMEKFSLNADLREDNRPGPGNEVYRNEVKEQDILKAIFKDKKLNKLWLKAEASGFTGDGLSGFDKHGRWKCTRIGVMTDGRSKFSH